MNFCKIAFSTVLLSCFASAAFAADRGHYNPQNLNDIDVSYSELSEDLESKLNKGSVLDYDLFQKGRVVYRDVTQGMVALRLENKVVRMIEDTREIVDILDTL
ncbi:hypothetical protein [Alteromonas lipotrueiana]|uniref:hypothetical protein n=1 Tax=Alteromonas lipotrueiana TaxID=2803815 RepID=UPI001C488D9E|nr:hypothetical protein [Alteromonas lipotrueiana]|tara:strand:+ start:377 stop:685 length:309 start_codon:yes stop_codon:yes gene_type:complete